MLELPSPRQSQGQASAAASLVGAARVQRLGFQCQLGQRLGLLGLILELRLIPVLGLVWCEALRAVDDDIYTYVT